MKIKLLGSYVSLLFLVLLVPGCGGDTKETVDTAPDKKSNLYVINVLDEKMYNECHILGSINVPFIQVKDWAQAIDKDAGIVVYCANYACTASGIGAKQLIDMGFKHVWAYESGMHDWHKNGLPSVCPVESTYLKRNNVPSDEEHDVPVISTIELKEKMIKHGFFH